jgi:6,7-dimethyl-8-ribityllumazine synthase
VTEVEASLNGAGLRVGIVVSRFNPEVGRGLVSSCLSALSRYGVAGDAITLVKVPGALEVPLALQKLAQTGRFDALVALGAVIRGETYHFEVVANQSAAGIAQVQLDTGVPIANGVLTTHNDDQAIARMSEKGEECALVAIEMANLCADLKGRFP